jgi:hypothetical protein
MNIEALFPLEQPTVPLNAELPFKKEENLMNKFKNDVKDFYNKHTLPCKIFIYLLYYGIGVAVYNYYEGWNFVQWYFNL